MWNGLVFFTNPYLEEWTGIDSISDEKLDSIIRFYEEKFPDGQRNVGINGHWNEKK